MKGRLLNQLIDEFSETIDLVASWIEEAKTESWWAAVEGNDNGVERLPRIGRQVIEVGVRKHLVSELDNGIVVVAVLLRHNNFVEHDLASLLEGFGVENVESGPKGMMKRVVTLDFMLLDVAQHETRLCKHRDSILELVELDSFCVWRS